jgi:hypothetical protein
MHDYYSGLETGTLTVTADFPVDGLAPGRNLAERMRPLSQGVLELRLSEPITVLPRGRLQVSVKDRQGNVSRIEGTFRVGDERGGLPERVHVFEDYATEIEKRWWLRGEPDGGGSHATETKDDLMGDPSRTWRAVVFNPVPGPPMGDRTRLSFRYRLEGTDALRVQIYSLTNGYHRRLVLRDLPQGAWRSAVVDMTRLRRPDGSGGPLSRDERIDDIQFYVEPEARLRIDDLVLYEPAPETEQEPFPRRVIFTGWFDTGNQGAEWPGDFEIVKHGPPLTWKAARSVKEAATGLPRIRVGLRGERPLGRKTRLRFRYRLEGSEGMRIALKNSKTGETWNAALSGLEPGRWAEARMDFAIGAAGKSADEIVFLPGDGATLLIDDLLLYEPGEARAF